MRRKTSRKKKSGPKRLQQLTLRGFDEELEKAIRRLAADERMSLNRAAMMLLRKGAGLGQLSKIGHSLDKYFGTWTEEEFREFQESQKFFDVIDEDLWK
jgi:hypothetical protein